MSDGFQFVGLALCCSGRRALGRGQSSEVRLPQLRAWRYVQRVRGQPNLLAGSVERLLAHVCGTALLFVYLATAFTDSSAAAPAVTLKDAFQGKFLIGAALNPSQFTESNLREAALVKAQFNTITPENVLKWGLVHPEPVTYSFDLPDRYVAFGESNGMFIIGHTLVWHHQTPDWVFRDEAGKPLSREALLERMHEHIRTVVGRYKGRIRGWDVVNEALNEDGTLRQSPWMKIIGEEYIAKAFEFAHEADPNAELYYNDFALENAPKRKGALALIKKLQAHGLPIAAIGLQHHDNLTWPKVSQVEATIKAFANLGLKVNISELDIDVLPQAMSSQTAEASLNLAARPELNPYTNGLPDSVQHALTKRYAELFSVFLKNRRVIERVTFWGVTDAASWLNNWPIRGRTNYPLLFDRSGALKPAFDAVLALHKP